MRYGTRRAEAAVARAAARRRDPLVLRDDRAGRGLVRRHQHPVDASSGDGDDYVINGRKWWISGRRRSALPDRDLHGQDRSRRAEAPAAVDDPGADGHARRRDQAACCRCSATTMRRTATPRSCSTTCACRRRTCCSARAAASRSRRAASGPGAFTTACASSAWPSARWS